MNLSSKIAVENLLEKYGLKPFKGWGQNFLINDGVLKKIIEAANIKLNDCILEIGPGIGTLTQELAKKAKKVFAIEKDSKMVEVLRKTLKNFKNVEIIQGDILKFQISNFKFSIKKVVANLPFNIASAAIRKFLESEKPPKEMILMVQKEVAQRICAKPPDMNLLAVSVQFYSEPKILFYVSKNSFWPKPKVDGAVLRISRIHTNLPRIDTNLFFKIVKAGFSQPRKQLANNLSKELKLDKEKVKNWLLKNGIQPSQRADTLDIKEWINLVISFKIEL